MPKIPECFCIEGVFTCGLHENKKEPNSRDLRSWECNPPDDGWTYIEDGLPDDTEHVKGALYSESQGIGATNDVHFFKGVWYFKRGGKCVWRGWRVYAWKPKDVPPPLRGEE